MSLMQFHKGVFSGQALIYTNNVGNNQKDIFNGFFYNYIITNSIIRQECLTSKVNHHQRDFYLSIIHYQNRKRETKHSMSTHCAAAMKVSCKPLVKAFSGSTALPRITQSKLSHYSKKFKTGNGRKCLCSSTFPLLRDCFL